MMKEQKLKVEVVNNQNNNQQATKWQLSVGEQGKKIT